VAIERPGATPQPGPCRVADAGRPGDVRRGGASLLFASSRYWKNLGRSVAGLPNNGGRCARRNTRLVALASDFGGHSYCRRRDRLLRQAPPGDLTSPLTVRGGYALLRPAAHGRRTARRKNVELQN
jgi:hypothetical protein